MFLKKITALAFCVICFASCSNDKRYTIKVAERIKDIVHGGYKNQIDSQVVKASGDSEAYVKGAQRFAICLQVADELKETEIDYSPVSFAVYDRNGLNIETRLAQKIKDSISSQTARDYLARKKPAKATQPYDSIAFAAVKFGMSEKQVNRAKSGQGTFVDVGSKQYLVDYRFTKDGKLYLVNMEGLEKTADYVDTEVQEQVDNLVRVISEKYGEPEIVTYRPNFLSFQPGYIQWLRKWDAGGKVIKVGAAEVSSGSEYRSVCWIYDKALYQAQETASSNATKVKEKKDASKF